MASSLFLMIGFLGSLSHATKVLVKDSSITISGLSYADPDLSNIYGGIAGTCTAAKNNVSTCNSCTNTTGLVACNQKSIYPDLQVTVSFQTSEDVTTPAVAKMYILNNSGSVVTTLPALAAQTYTANVTTATFTTTWSVICSAAGMGANCTTAGTGVFLAKLAFGVDSDNNGDVDSTSTESKIITAKIHYIDDLSPTIANTYCPTTASTTPGYCKIEFEPGDQKVYVKVKPDSSKPITGGIDSSYTNGSIEFDAIAIFPIPITTADITTETTAINNFTTGQVAPIFQAVDTTDNSNILDEQVKGLTNYQTYCFIYGNRNKAQNIYRIVAGNAASADATAIAPQICLAPSEVAGLLEDKHCFISTAAFGSDMAKEVQTFRQFRNQFLLTNTFGRIFVKTYYKLSPPLAGVIARSEVLRSLTRTGLYPFLAFSYIAIHFGILAALLTLLVCFILLFKVRSVVKQKRLLLVLFILILTPALKAQIVPETQVIQRPDAQEGLLRITKDGTYIYDVKRVMKKESSRITFGHALEPEVSIDIEKRDPTTGNGTGQFQTFNFGDLYQETSSFILGYDYENFPWVSKKGKLGWQLGGALMYAQGHGILESTLLPSREKFTFLTLPFLAGVVYRLEWKDRQIVAPYVSGGGTYTALIEKREDKATPQITGAAGFYAAGGLLFNITAFDEESGYALDSEYGISNLWVSLEYKAIEVQSEAFNFSDRYVNAGVAFDF